MDLEIKGKIAVVTAASKGLGKEVAISLAREGANLVICARGEEELEKTRREIEDRFKVKIFSFTCDVTKREDVEKFRDFVIDEFKTVHMLFTNAGGPPPGGFFDFKPEDYLKAINLNLMSAIYLVYSFIPYMKEQRYGRIVASTSITVKQPLKNLILSNVSRTGVVSFIKSLSNEVAPYNITANCVAPGYTMTDRVRKLMEDKAKRENISVDEALKTITKDIPMGRIGDPSEFADVVTFLLSERASYITGATIQIDGGYYRGLM